MKKTQQASGPLSPERYIKERGRSLPIDRCFCIDNDSGMYDIFVVRRHPKGTYSYACYLVDSWCTGVKDSLWRFSTSEEELEDFCNHLSGNLELREISYEEAHNRIYGAIAFAEDAGIEPGPGWKYTQYLLEEDTDKIPLIEYEYGDKGKYHLTAPSWDEARRYTTALDKNIGRDNYQITIGEEM